jgi:hypothetical protein
MVKAPWRVQLVKGRKNHPQKCGESSEGKGGKKSTYNAHKEQKAVHVQLKFYHMSMKELQSYIKARKSKDVQQHLHNQQHFSWIAMKEVIASDASPNSN